MLNASGEINIANSFILNDVRTGAVGKGGNIDITAGSLSVTNGARLNASTFGHGDAGSVFVQADGVSLVNGNIFSNVEREASGNAGGIFITAGSLLLTNGAQLQSGLRGADGTLSGGRGKGGQVSIDVSDNVTIEGFHSGIFTDVEAGAVGNAGSILITAKSVSLREGAQLISRTSGRGDAGSVVLQASDSVSLENGDIFSTVESGAEGNGGLIDINAGLLSLTNGAQIITSVLGANGILAGGHGNAGSVNIDVSDKVTIAGRSAIFTDVEAGAEGDGGEILLNAGSFFLSDGARLVTDTSGEGDAGGIVITAGSVSLSQGVRLSSSTLGQGDAGSVSVQATDEVSLANSLIDSSVSSIAKGNGGNIDIRAGEICLSNGATLFASNLGQGDAGAVSVQATGSVSVANSQIYSSVGSGVVGRGGDITIQAESLSLSDDASLVASNLGGQGNAGNISVQVRDAVFLEGGGILTAVASVESEAVGNGGNIDISAGSLFLTDGALLNATTAGQGNAGNISVQATDEVSLTNSSRIGSAVLTGAVGKGGDINIQARELSLTNGAGVLSNTFAQGNAGNVNIDVSDAVSLEGGASILSGVASVESEAVGNGGNIDIRAGSLSLIDGAEVSAQSQGTGRAGSITINTDGDLNANNGKIIAAASIAGGGNINVTARDIRLRGNSDIRTNLSSGSGSGGNINLTANTIVALDDSDILAFAPEGRGGNITFRTSAFLNSTLYRPAPPSTLNALEGNLLVDINASGAIAGAISGVPDVSFLQNSFTELPENLINTNLLIANSCIAGSSRQGGSFIITSADGFPTRPGDASISHYPTGTVRSIPSSDSSSDPRSSVSGTNSASPWKLGDPIVEPQGVYRLADGQLVLSRECRN